MSWRKALSKNLQELRSGNSRNQSPALHRRAFASADVKQGHVQDPLVPDGPRKPGG